MYLEKLEIQGFKSFANKNALKFPGMVSRDKRGITAVVGPNGSGKSNVADSVRWALGEQSMKTLRGKKSEDVIFSGSDKKGKLGMAEVSLHLNNEDKKAPIDYSQIVLTRRLYRTGESEYLINNNRSRLADIQMLLAKANFGQKTYSVIGQGMVEGFLNTSLAERKEFFDEATGVKQYQIKRDESLNKLRSCYENLDQVNMLLVEIEPRLKSLTRQVNKLKKRSELEVELKELQLKYYRKTWHEINDKFKKYNTEFLSLEQERMEKEKKLAQLNRELEKMEQSSRVEKNESWQEDLDKAREEKEKIVKEIAKLDAQLEIKLESQGKFDLSWLNNKREEIKKDIISIGDEIESLNKNISHEKVRFSELGKERGVINERLEELNEKLLKLSRSKEGGGQPLPNKRLENILAKLKEVSEQDDIVIIKDIISNIKNEVNELVKQIEQRQEKEKIEETQNRIIETSALKEEVIIKIGESNLRISAREERVKLLVEKEKQLTGELEQTEKKLLQNADDFNSADFEKQKNDLMQKLNTLEVSIKELKEKQDALNIEEEKERERLFALQKNIQSIQNEINEKNNRLGELRVNSARYETRLEDLEIEIRNNLGGLKEIKEKKEGQDSNEEAMRENIKRLKNQLEMIGGIDPEIESEYSETKERFDFLEGQVNDLQDAVSSLEKIIIELDLTIKERFDKEFKIIAEKFNEYFKILFNGGSAKIMKVVEDAGEKSIDEKLSSEDGSEKREGVKQVVDLKKIKFLKKHNATGLAGIEIQATPPGKKITSVSMLSGGERALTAIALICAIISANPSPFVVLDEVDAALDEANSERLAKILDDLSHKTQFIVITHNRASMRRANVLYGVTMGDDGISKLLSVKLDKVNLD